MWSYFLHQFESVWISWWPLHISFMHCRTNDCLQHISWLFNLLLQNIRVKLPISVINKHKKYKVFRAYEDTRSGTIWDLCMMEHGSYISLVNKTVNNVHDIFSQLFIVFLRRQKRETNSKVRLIVIEDNNIHRKQNYLHMWNHALSSSDLQRSILAASRTQKPASKERTFSTTIWSSCLKKKSCISNLITWTH